MPREVYGAGYAFLQRAELSASRRSRGWRASLAAQGVRKVRLTGGEPLLRRDLERLVEMLARIDGIEEVALTTNGLLLAGKARALADAGLDRVTVSLDALDDRRSARDQRRADLRARGCSTGIDAAVAAGLQPGEGQHGRSARRQRGAACSRWPSTSATAARSCCASSSTWTSARPTAGAARTSCRPRRSCERIAARWPLRGARAAARAGEVATRYRYSDGGGRDRRDPLGQRAVLRQLHARAAVGRRQAVHVPVRAPRARPARNAARRRERTASSPSAPARSGRPGATATRRSEPHVSGCAGRPRRSRCPTSAVSRC